MFSDGENGKIWAYAMRIGNVNAGHENWWRKLLWHALGAQFIGDLNNSQSLLRTQRRASI